MMMSTSRMLALQSLAGFAIFSTVQAADFYHIHSTHPPNFLAFYPDLRDSLLNITLGTCSRTLQEYNAAPGGEGKYVPCNNMVSCVLGALDQSSTSKISSAAVLLGLTPVILATMGPSLAEVSLLSSRRPLLSLLLGVGSPSVFFERIASYSDPLEVLRPRTGNLVIHRFRSHTLSTVVSVLEYLIASLAIINVVTNSVQLGEWTVLSWRCADTSLVLLWSLLPFFIHLVAAISFNASKGAKVTGLRGSASRNAGKSNFKQILLSEFALSANRPKPRVQENSDEEGMLVVSLQWVATLFGFVHIVFGTMVLSGLLFVVPKDALMIVGRYMASSFFSRAIVIFEIAGLRNDPVPRSSDHFVNNGNQQDNRDTSTDKMRDQIALVDVTGTRV